ncbi:helix-turn-helix domain-containing protein [Viridibacillus sp. NPDC096237]|uniref:helix-turn-helix domain-containing protein n=1 Tax=Viridibacillus sp. NPDC096237 TaxID=3390721 RepID=UPI003D0241E5
MGWSMEKRKRKKKRKQPYPSDDFRNVKGSNRERLILERKTRRFTQKQLGEIIGCSAAMISQLELGKTNPSIDISIQLEEVLETPFLELFPDL